MISMIGSMFVFSVNIHAIVTGTYKQVIMRSVYAILLVFLTFIEIFRVSDSLEFFILSSLLFFLAFYLININFVDNRNSNFWIYTPTSDYANNFIDWSRVTIIHNFDNSIYSNLFSDHCISQIAIRFPYLGLCLRFRVGLPDPQPHQPSDLFLQEVELSLILQTSPLCAGQYDL